MHSCSPRLSSSSLNRALFLIVSHRNDQRVSAIGSRRLQDRLEAAHIHNHLFEAPEGDHGTAAPEDTALKYAFFAETLRLH